LDDSIGSFVSNLGEKAAGSKISPLFERRTLNPANQSPTPPKHEKHIFSKIAVFGKSQNFLI
jgi:hypothetical protein